MDAKELHSDSSQSLMDEIASDPEIINRGAPEPAPEVVTPVIPATKWDALGAGVARSKAGKGKAALLINLLGPAKLPESSEPVAAGKPGGRRKGGIVLGVVLVVLVGGGVAAYYVLTRPVPELVAQATPTATPVPTTTPTPAPTASLIPTATPTPAPTPVQNAVSAPAAPPTPGHPQTVTVKSKTGLWLRSTPNSSNQRNVIGWMRYNGQVSVDSVGDFWWHGTYAGKAGYFAVKYTQ